MIVFFLNVPYLQGGNETRWESNKEATDVLRRILPAVLADLSKQATKEPTAAGLLKFLTSEFFPPTIVFMKNVHLKLHKAFACFQQEDVFFSNVEEEVSQILHFIFKILGLIYFVKNFHLILLHVSFRSKPSSPVFASCQ